MTWTELKNIVLNEVSHAENNLEHSCSVLMRDLVTVAEAGRKIPHGCKAKQTRT